MKIKIKEEVFQKVHPRFRIAFILVKNLDNRSKLRESEHLLQEIEEISRFLFHQESPQNHYLLSPWAALQQQLGKKVVRTYHTSLEKLINRVIKNKRVKSSSVITNLVSYLSLKHLLPVSVDDFHRLQGDLTFQLSTGREKVSFLRNLRKNTPFYRDEKRILGTKLDFWKSPFTKPAQASTACLIHLEALPSISGQKLKEIVREAARLIQTFSGGKTKTLILSKSRSSASL